MVYELINSNYLIGSVFDRFNIDYSGFISRVPNWIHSAMQELEIYSSLVSAVVDGQVVDYKCAIPEDTHILDGVSYLGFRLNRYDAINQKTTDEMPNLVHNTYGYELDNNGYIITTFKECELGDLKFYIKKLPVELDSKTNLYFPLIPKNQDLTTALEWYVLKRLLERGHKVGMYSLEKNNVYVNPAMAWDKYSRIAKNSVSKLDIDERNTISKMIRTFLVDYNYHNTVEFNNTNINN